VRPGFTVSASIDGINQITHVLTPTAFKYLENITLERVEFSGGYMENITITVHEPESPREDVNFSLNPMNNSVTVNVTKLFA
jgi:hypothetical protein